MSTIITQGDNMLSYGDIPVLIDNITSIEQYNADLGIIYNKLSSTNITISNLSFVGGVNVPTKIEFATPPPYKKNSIVWVEGDIFGYFKILELGSNYIIINFQISSSFPVSVDIYNISLLRGSLGEGEGQITFNLKNEISDFVTPQIKETNQLYPAPLTTFNYSLILNESFQFEIEFEDNAFVLGNVGFTNSAITSLTNIPFKIGDLIEINQNNTIKNFPQYTRDSATNLNLAFRGDNNGNVNQFRVGQTVNVLDGDFPGIYEIIRTDVTDVPGREVVVVNREYDDSAVTVNASTLVANIRPEYDGVTTIKDIFIDIVLGLVVVTDKPFTDSSVAISGRISYPQNKRLIKWNASKKNDNRIIFGNLGDFQWEQNNADEYIIDLARTFSDNYISTILPSYISSSVQTMDKLKVNREDYLFGLVHSLSDFSKQNFVVIETFDKNYNQLGEIGLMNSDLHTDYYFPMALSQIRAILGESYVIQATGDLNTYFNNVKFYKIRIHSTVNFLTREIGFEISDCSNFENISLNFIDDRGSLLSVPTNLVSRQFSEFNQNEYYKNTGEFSDNNWSYGDFRNKTIFNNREIIKFRLTTDWLKDFDAEIVRAMLASSHKYMTIDNMLIPIVTLNDEVEVKKLTNDQIFNYTFEVTIASDKFRK